MGRGYVLVTGASSGIGQATALHVRDLGFHVFAGVRQAADGEALCAKAPTGLTPVMLDVTDQASISQAHASVDQATGERGLAGLVNNAGLAVGGILEFLPLEQLRHQLEVNVVGQLAVTQAFLPAIRQARGRIVNIGSMSGRVANPFVGPYAMSKFALEALTNSLRQELRPWGIHVCLIGPGSVATPIRGKSLAHVEGLLAAMPPRALELYGEVLDKVWKYQRGRVGRGLPPAAVAKVVEHALTSSHPRTRYVVGQDAQRFEWFRLLPDTVREHIVANRLKGLQAKQPTD